MSDATLTEEVEAEAVEAPDHGETLSAAFVEASNLINEEADGLTDEGNALVHEGLRAVPAGARGKAQGVALKAVLVDGNADALEFILTAINNLPKASGKRASGPQLDPVDALALQAAGVLVAYSVITSDPEYGEEASAKAKEWYASGAPSAHQEAILRIADSLVVQAGKRGARRGTRTTYTDTLGDLIDRGDIKTPATITMKNGDKEVEGKILKNGKVKVGSTEYENPSQAATAVRKSERSLNGWAEWKLDGKALGTYRKG